MSSGNNSGVHPNYRGCSKSSKTPVSSELSSSESITSSSELSSSSSLTTCSCEDGGCTVCDYSLFRNKKERKRDEIRFMKRRKKLSKRRNPFKMSSKNLKKLESKRNSKKEALKVLESALQNSHCKSKF